MQPLGIMDMLKEIERTDERWHDRKFTTALDMGLSLEEASALASTPTVLEVTETQPDYYWES